MKNRGEKCLFELGLWYVGKKRGRDLKVIKEAEVRGTAK